MAWWQQALGAAPTAAPSGGSTEEEVFAQVMAQARAMGGGMATEPNVYVGLEPALSNTPNFGGSPLDAIGEGIAGIARSVGGAVRPRSEADGLIYQWDSGRIGAFQDRLVSAGLVQADEIVRGQRDMATLGAWRALIDESAIALAAGVQKSPWDMLNELQGAATTGAAEEQFVAEVSNPEDIKRGLRDAFREALGSGDIDDERLNKAVVAFQAAQTSSQRAAFDAKTTGGTVTAPPSFEAFADEQAQQADPVAYDAYKALDAFSVIKDRMLGGINA